MTAIRSRQILANGLTFAIDEAGDGDCVALFLHGFPECRRSWRRQLPLLANLGWRAVAPDLRGYGQSSRPEGRHAYGLDHLVTDVGALFDALGAQRRLLIGHDWGGMIAWAAAAWRIRALDGLVIMNAPHPAAYADHVRRSPAQMARSWYALFFQIPRLPEAILTRNGAQAIQKVFLGIPHASEIFTPDDLDQYRANALPPGAMTAMVNYYRANAGALARAPRTMSRPIDIPALLIWGDQDPYLAADLAELCRPYAPALSVRRLADAGHWVQQEAASKVNDAIGVWMSEHLPAASGVL